MSIATTEILLGDAREVLKTLDDESVQCVVTSPPYFNLRDYRHENQLGLENSPQEYICNLMRVFQEVYRVLKSDGTFWLNIGDTYTKNKQLIGIPWQIAFTLQNNGWILRSDIIWHKPAPMPDGARDRPTKTHEYVFLLTKSSNYYYNRDAIREPYESGTNWIGRKSVQNLKSNTDRHDRGAPASTGSLLGRNKRSVWVIPTQKYKEAHFAVFPAKLVEPCILAGSKEGDTVLDPFFGSGVTGLVANQLGRNCIGIELNPEYVELAKKRLENGT